MVEILDKYFSGTNFQAPVLALPWLRHVLPKWSGWTSIYDTNMRLVDFIRQTLSERRYASNKTDAPRDLIDVYLNKILDCKDNPNTSFHGERGYQNLRANLMDLLIAGIETTSTALNWSILYMVRNPDIQEKVHKEINSVLGKDRLPCYEDRLSLPFVEATLHEVQRIAAIVPIAIPHYTTKDIDVSGFRIPKGIILT